MPNAFDTPSAKFLQNAEVNGILSILGAGHGKNFDISKCPFQKVIILSDADMDGLHIRVLLLKFFLRYCRPLVEAGRVYAGLTPLYNVDMGTKNWEYFIDMNAVLDYVRKDFLKNHSRNLSVLLTSFALIISKKDTRALSGFLL
jgi:DNA gyrase/topoisomerase IV subunit B